MDTVNNVKKALDELGVHYREAGSSLKIQECPACGNADYKVHLRIDDEDSNAKHKMLFGRCYSGGCQENFSSVKYLTMSGMPREDALQYHGLNSYDFLGILNNAHVDAVVANPVLAKPKLKQVADVSKFITYTSWIEHPAAKYAARRGAVPELNHIIKIDPETNSVVFIVYDETGDPIGWQKRFVKPSNPKFKTQTSTGFAKSENLLVFCNNNKDLVVCEGPFTALAAYRYGYTGICTFGSGISMIQKQKIADLAKKLGVRVGLCLDNDLAGIKAFDSLNAFMYNLGNNIFRVKIKGEVAAGWDLSDAWEHNLEISEDTNLPNPALLNLERFL